MKVKLTRVPTYWGIGILNFIGGVLGFLYAINPREFDFTERHFESDHPVTLIIVSLLLISSAVLLIIGGHEKWVRIYTRIVIWSQMPVVMAFGWKYFSSSIMLFFVGVGRRGTFAFSFGTTAEMDDGSGSSIKYLGINLIALIMLVQFNKIANLHAEKNLMPKNKHQIGNKPSKKEIDQRTREMYD